MLVLMCRACRKSYSYAAEEFIGHFFVCKSCQTVNLLRPEDHSNSQSDASVFCQPDPVEKKQSSKRPKKTKNQKPLG